MRLRSRLLFGISVAACGNTYSPTATAYFDAMTTPPDASWKAAANTLINSLVSAGIWAKLDWLSLPAPGEQGFRVNAVAPSQVMTAVNSPTYTPRKGFTGDGATSYLNTGWNPTTAPAPRMTQNDAHMGVWAGTDLASTSMADLGNAQAMINSWYNALQMMAAPMASTFAFSSGISGSAGHSIWTRTSASAGQWYKNGSAGAAIASASAIRNAPFLVLARNISSTGTVAPDSYSARRVQAVHWGSQLSGAEAAALYSALNTFMTAVGAA